MAVVGCKTAAGCSLRSNNGRKRFDILGGVSFPQEDVLTKKQFLFGLFCSRTLMVACNSAGDILAERFTGKSRSMSVNPAEKCKLCRDFCIAEKNARNVHHLAKT